MPLLVSSAEEFSGAELVDCAIAILKPSGTHTPMQAATCLVNFGMALKRSFFAGLSIGAISIRLQENWDRRFYVII